MSFGLLSKANNGNDSNFDSSDISTTCRSKQEINAYSYICVTFDEIKNSLIFVNENAFLPIICKLEFDGISTFVRWKQELNAFSHIFVTFCGIQNSSIVESENASFSINCKLEFDGISTFLRFLQ